MSGSGTSDTLVDFLRWSGETGVEQSGVNIEIRPGRGHCVVANRYFAEGDSVLAIPSGASLAQTHETGPTSVSLLEGLVHRVLDEEALGSKSSFAPYIRLIFEAEVPILNVEECSKFPGLAGSCVRGRERGRAGLVEKLRAGNVSLPIEKVSYAVDLVSNRALFAEEHKACMMVPVFDLINHDSRPNAFWKMGADLAVTVVARKPIEAGEEVLVCYSDEPNTQLFTTYGFVLQGDGPHRCLDLFVSLHPPEEQRYGTNANVEVRVLSNGGIKQRSALAPLIAKARQFVELGGDKTEPRAHEAVVAKAIVRSTRSELGGWLAVMSSSKDGVVVAMAEENIAILTQLLSRAEDWLAGPKDTSIMIALSAAPPDLPTDDDSSSSESEAGSDVEEQTAKVTADS